MAAPLPSTPSNSPRLFASFTARAARRSPPKAASEVVSSRVLRRSRVRQLRSLEATNPRARRKQNAGSKLVRYCAVYIDGADQHEMRGIDQPRFSFRLFGLYHEHVSALADPRRRGLDV